MRLIGRRPLVKLCAAMLISALSAVWIDSSVIPLLVGAELLIAIVFLILLRSGRVHFYTFCMVIGLSLAVLIGFASSSRFYTEARRFEADAGQMYTVEGQITEQEWGTNWSSGYILHANRINGKRCNAYFLLSCDGTMGLSLGTSICVKAPIGGFSPDENGFNEKRYYLSRGISGEILVASPESIELRETSAVPLSVRFARISLFLAARLRLLLGEDCGRFLSALFLGRRGDLEGTVVRDFRRLGITHVLALSGLHLAILVGAAEKLLLAFRVGRKWRRITQLSFVLVYVLLAGAPASILRAAIMLTFGILMSIFFDERDGITTLFCAVSAICLFNPASLLDLGLWMSFLATLTLFLTPKLGFDRLPRMLGTILQSIWVTGMVNLTLLPFVALVNGEFSFLAVWANLILVPLCVLLLYVAPIVLLTGRLFAFSVKLLSALLLHAMDLFARIRGISVSLAAPEVQLALLPLFLAAVFLLLFSRKHRKRTVAFVLALALIVSGGITVFSVLRRDARVIYVNDEGNDALIFRSDAGTLICDFSDGKYSALRASANAAQTLGAAEIDMLMLSHYHKNHITSIRRLFSERVVHTLLLPAPRNETERDYVTSLTEIAAESKTEIRIYREREALTFGNVTLTPYTKYSAKSGAHPTFLFVLNTGEDQLTYMSSNVLEGGLSPIARRHTSESRYVIIGAHGDAPMKKLLLDTPNAEEIVVPDQKIAQIVIPSPEITPNVADEIVFRLG